jgi:HD-GYP domain-containing protein (c-di-GMP phosphodiesterase class II)
LPYRQVIPEKETPVQAQPLVSTAPDETAPLNQALNCWQGWQDLTDRLEPILAAPGEQANFGQAIEGCARTVLDLCRQDADVAVAYMVHDTPDKLQRYGILHSVHTAMLLALVARRRDWSPTLTFSAVQAGLTMNIAITGLQSDLAQQTEPLSLIQRADIHAHPQASVHRLRELGVTDEDWLMAVMQHHEQPDGKGYPAGITQVSLLADALRTCDVYSAKMAPRVGRSVMQSPKAATQIFRERSANYFGATLTREMGLYPPGTLVHLSSGQEALAMRRGADLGLPVVITLRDAGDGRWEPVARAQTNDATLSITMVHEANEWAHRLDMRQVLALC